MSLTITPEQQKLVSSYYQDFLTYTSKIIVAFKETTQSERLLTKREEDFVRDYKHFVVMSKKYEKRFFNEMFSEWVSTIVDARLIEEDPIDYRRYDIFIDLDELFRWGRVCTKTRPSMENTVKLLNISLLKIALFWHKSDSFIEICEERIRELTPVQQARTLPNDFAKQLSNGISTFVDTNPTIKSQLPQGFDINSMMNNITSSNAMNQIVADAQSGKGFDFGNIMNTIMGDPKIQSMLSEMNENENKPKTFAELPENLQPPGIPVSTPSPSSPPPSSSPHSSLPSSSPPKQIENVSKDKEVEYDYELE